MKINAITQIRSQIPLIESREHRTLYESWHQVSRLIQERQLTDQEIQKMFTDIQASPAWNDAGGNRTIIGKGVDTAKSTAGAVSGAWNRLKDQIYNSSAMQGFSTAFDRTAEALKQATGGDQGLMQYVQKYRDFANKHPIMQKAVYAALVSAAGIVGSAGGPAGIGAAVALLQTFDKTIQGEDIRRALWSGAKAGAVAGGAATLANYMQSSGGGTTGQAAATQGQPSAAPGSSGAGPQLRGFGADNAVVAGMQAKQDILRQFAEKMGLDPTNVTGTMQGGVPTTINGVPVPQNLYSPQQLTAIQAAKSLGSAMAGETNEAVESPLSTSGNVFEHALNQIPLRRIAPASMINRDETMISWTLNESMGQGRGGVYLTDLGVATLFENLGRVRFVLLEADDPRVARAKAALGVGDQPLTDFGTVGAKRAAALQANQPKQPGFLSRAWGGVKSAAQKAGGALGRAGAEFTTKVTAQRLLSNWNKIKEYDSDRLAKWLMAAPQSVPQAVVSQVYQDMGIPAPATDQPTTVGTGTIAPSSEYTARQSDAGDYVYRDHRGNLKRISKDEYEQMTGGDTKAAAPAAGKEPVTIGGQKLDPQNPQHARVIAQAEKAATGSQNSTRTPGPGVAVGGLTAISKSPAIVAYGNKNYYIDKAGNWVDTDGAAASADVSSYITRMLEPIQGMNYKPAQVVDPTFDPSLYPSRKTAAQPATPAKKTRTGGRVKGTLSTNPRAVRRREANAAKKKPAAQPTQPVAEPSMSDLIRQRQAQGLWGLTEELIWAETFDPSHTLLEKIRRES